MSRRSPRFQVRFAATVQIAGVEHTLVCHTRDISKGGCLLDTAELIAEGVPLLLAVMDNQRGEVVQVEGEVARIVDGSDGSGRGIGVRLVGPPPEWQGMVERYRLDEGGAAAPLRLAVLVVGDPSQERGVLALYVTSGWDVRFASDESTAREALNGVSLDAVILEYDLNDPRASTILEEARKRQPQAKRILRCTFDDRSTPRPEDSELIDRIVDRDSGLEALLDALAAEFPETQ